MTSDLALLQQYAEEKEEAAFAELVRRHLAGVYSAALRRVGGDAHAADDVAQRVFVALARKAPALARHPCLTGWLYMATRNEAAKLVRGEQRRRLREKAAAEAEDAAAAGRQPDWAAIAEVLDEAMDRLGQLDRDLILLRVVDRLSYQELGERFRLKEDAARMRLQRAMERLRTMLGQGGVVSSAALLETGMTEHAAAAVPAEVARNVVHAALAAAPGAGTAAGLGAALLAVLLSPTAALFFAVGAAVMAATWEFQRSRRAEQEWLDAKTAYDSAVASAHVHLRAARADAAAAISSKSHLSDAMSAAAGDDPSAEGKAFLLRHPEVKTALADFVDADGMTKYRGLFRELNLTSDQIARFLALRRQAFGEFGRSLENGTVHLSLSDSPDFRQYDRDVRNLLGPDGYQAYLNYDAHGSARTFAANLASLLATSQEPLTEAQASVIGDLYFQSTRTKDPAQKEAILAQAQSALSGYQYGVMTQLRGYMAAVGWFHD